MQRPASPHFQTINISAPFKAHRAQLTGGPTHDAASDAVSAQAYGSSVCRGIPFLLGHESEPNVAVIKPGDDVEVRFESRLATGLIFLHAAEDRTTEPAGALG